MLHRHCEKHNSFEFHSLYSKKVHDDPLFSVWLDCPHFFLLLWWNQPTLILHTFHPNPNRFLESHWIALLRQIDIQFVVSTHSLIATRCLTKDWELQRVVPLYLCSLIFSFLMSWNRKLILGVRASEWTPIVGGWLWLLQTRGMCRNEGCERREAKNQEWMRYLLLLRIRCSGLSLSSWQR